MRRRRIYDESHFSFFTVERFKNLVEYNIVDKTCATSILFLFDFQAERNVVFRPPHSLDNIVYPSIKISFININIKTAFVVAILPLAGPDRFFPLSAVLY